MPYTKKATTFGDFGNIIKFMSPMKMFDYLGSSKIILSADIPVLREVLISNYNSILVKNYTNVNSWKSIIDKIMNDPILMGIAILISVLVLYSVLKKLFKFLAILIAILVIYLGYLTQIEGLSYEDATNKVKENTEGIIKETEKKIKEGKESFNKLQNESKKGNK